MIVLFQINTNLFLECMFEKFAMYDIFTCEDNNYLSLPLINTNLIGLDSDDLLQRRCTAE